MNIFNQTHGRYIPCDQSAYNTLINHPFFDTVLQTNHTDNWACQCGTTLDAQKQYLWQYLLSSRPKVENGVAVNDEGAFNIVHQYDRVPELKAHIEKIYA